MKRKPASKPKGGATTAGAKPDPNRYPKGWDRKKVQALIDHYENQSDDDAISEAKAAYASTQTSMIAVPVALVPKVQKLIAKQAS